MNDTNEVRVPYEIDGFAVVGIYNAAGEHVRTEWPSNAVWHYENGERVRTEWFNGSVYHYENGQHVRTEWPDGVVDHYEDGGLVWVEYPGGKPAERSGAER